MGAQFVTFPLGAKAAGGAEKQNVGELRDLIHLEMPQLNQALTQNKSSSQVWMGLGLKCSHFHSVHYTDFHSLLYCALTTDLIPPVLCNYCLK